MSTVSSRTASSRTEPDVWQEPVRGGYPDLRLLALPGLEQMRAYLRGLAPKPPIHHLTGMRPTEVGVGSAVFVMPASEWLVVPQGLISGGILALLADGSLGSAVQTILPPATLYTTSELSLNVLRPVRPTGDLIARGRIVHGGRSLGLSEVFVEDSNGRLLAHGSSRCYVFEPFSPAPEPPDGPPHWEEPDYPGPDPYLRPVQGEVLAPEVWASRSGLDIVRAQMTGELPPPPVHYLTGMRPIAASEGSATFALPASAWLCPPHGRLQGGAIALLADSALGTAVQTTVPAGAGYAPLDLHVNFLRPVSPDGQELTAVAQVINRGRSMAIATAEVFNAVGKKVAFASSSSQIVDRPVTAHDPLEVVDQQV